MRSAASGRGFRSGWYSRARRRYAAWIASRSALGSTWRVRYRSVFRPLVAAAGAPAAAAAALRDVVGVGHGETAAHQPIDIVDLGALYVLSAHWVDQDTDALE